MQIFASTTSLGEGRTNLAEILPIMNQLGVEGLELGSTHLWQDNLIDVIQNNRPKRLLTHNYFPPAKNEMVINLASSDSEVRKASLEHARVCIDFAASIGAELYTVHPGFLATTAFSKVQRSAEQAFDFEFVGATASHEQAFELMLDALSHLLNHSKKCGIRLAIETEGSLSKAGMLLMETPEEYRRIFSELGRELKLNFNLAHSYFASKHYGYNLNEFILEFRSQIAAVEISHNNGQQDEHKPLTSNSYLFPLLPLLPNVPLILEFREATLMDIRRSIDMLLSTKEILPSPKNISMNDITQQKHRR